MIRNNSLSGPHVSVGEEASVPRADIHHVYLSAGALQTFLQRRRKITAGATKTISGEMEEAHMRLQLLWQSHPTPHIHTFYLYSQKNTLMTTGCCWGGTGSGTSIHTQPGCRVSHSWSWIPGLEQWRMTGSDERKEKQTVKPEEPQRKRKTLCWAAVEQRKKRKEKICRVEQGGDLVSSCHTALVFV